MIGIDDRPIAVLDRASALASTSPAPRVEAASSDRPLPRGWGSHEERRLVRWGLLGYLTLAAYAVVFVLLAELVWS